MDAPSALQPRVLAPAVHLPLLLPHIVQILLTCAGIIGITVTGLRSVELRVPGWETSWPPGGCVFPTCRFYEIFSALPPGQAIFSPLSHELLSLCFCIPVPALSFSLGVKLLTADGSSASLFLNVLVPAVLSGFFSWLQFPFQSSGRIFSAITIFFWTWPIRRFLAALLLPCALHLHLLLLLLSGPLFSPPQSVSPTFFPILQTSFPPMVLQHLRLATKSATIFSHTPDLLFLPKPVA